ncbi:MAG: DUF2341 domain-containing protein, partial [Spirochaetales bacterium]|nr:DUF2341 domain-containing protein [Spirochaetales bacterium]
MKHRSRLSFFVIIPVSVALLYGCSQNGAWDLVASEIDAFENDEPEEEPVAEEPVAEPPWRRRIPITIEGTETNEILFNFPVMVHLSSGTLETDLLNETGDNLAFFPEEWTEGLEPLDHSISTWNPQGDSIAWVKIPFILAGSDRTTIWLYYGGTQRVEPADEGVWENAYTLVMHFEEGNASEGYRDSGVFANHSVPSPGHTEPDTATGAVGNAIDIVETTDAVIVPNSPSLETMEPFSISMLVNFRGYRTARVFSKGDYYLQTKASSGQAQYKFELQFDN